MTPEDTMQIGIVGFVATSLLFTVTIACDKENRQSQQPLQKLEKPAEIKMASIPGGSFRMGDIQNYGRYDDEKPVHDVTLSILR